VNDDVAIKVSHISKSFRVPHEKHNSLKDKAVHIFGPRNFTKFKSLENIDFEIKRGEFFGIIGKNGSGKSTLLKILANIYQPTSGKVTINGSLAPFIELGVGFNMELTGRENVFLSGTILGLKKKKIEEIYDDIVDFAELGEFMDQKLKNYSSGMQVRLAFSIAIRAKSDIMLIDEVLAVGDTSFQKKCFNEFRKIKKEGRTIVFVSHDMESILEFCDRVAVINNSRLVANTSPFKAAEIYNKLNATKDLVQIKQSIAKKRSGSGDVKVLDVTFMNVKGTKKDIFETGKPMKIAIKTSKNPKVDKITVGLAFYSQDGINLAGPNSGKQILQSGDEVLFELSQLPLVPGNYLLTIGIFDADGRQAYDFIEKGFTFSVISPIKYHGNTAMFADWKTKTKPKK
jgi:ABC-2 type transport system ATP-binding protein